MRLFQPEIIAVRYTEEFPDVSAESLWQAFQTASSFIPPAGDTLLRTYNILANRYHDDPVWNRLTYCELDEYKGLKQDDPRLFQNWLGDALLNRIGIPSERRITFFSDAPDPDAECRRMEELIRALKPDVGIYGLGLDHTGGFNFKGSPFDAPCRVVKLTDIARASNARYRGGQKVPPEAYTLGFGTLSYVQRHFFVVSGAAKAGVLHEALHGEVGPDNPGSWLRTQDNVTVIADYAALGR